MAEQKPKNPHKHHRERVRELFLQSGLDGFSDHNVLEFLLFYTVPQGDTNLTAHRLIETFGSLQGVLEAPVQSLMQVSGVGQYTAVFLSMLPQLARRYARAKTTDRFRFDDFDAMQAFVRSRFIGERVECFYLLSFNASGNYIHSTKLAAGSVTQMRVENRVVMETALRTGAVYAALAHNHPGGVAAPSAADVQTTREIASLLSGVGIRLVDHMIVADNECFSMVRQPRFRPLFV
ncbi:MAG: RadC family protein [Clostridia bacterium]|nr:RadC family protein [Clostridia bacterium]